MSANKDPETRTSTVETQTTFLLIPDGGVHAWSTVAALFLFNFATWASNSAYAVFFAYYLQYNTFPTATKLDYAAIGGLTFGCGLLFGPLVRLVVRLFGIRVTVVIGGCVQFLGIMLAAFSTKLWEIYMTQGVLSGVGLALIIIPSLSLIPQWFKMRRSLAAAIAATGSGIGGIIFTLGLETLVSEHGLRLALIVEAIICGVCVFGGVLLMHVNPRIHQTLAIWDWKMLTYPCYWLFVGYVSFSLLGFMVLLYNLADFTISLGYTSHQGSVVAAMIAVGNCVGRPTVGRLCDLFGPVTTTMCVSFVVALFCFAMWIPASNYATAVAFGLIQGSMMGTLWVVLAVLCSRVVGLKKLDVALSMVWMFVGAFGTASPVIGITLRGPEGEYKNPAIWCGAVYAAAGACLWLLRAYLIARDVEAEKVTAHDHDNDELHIGVPLTHCLGALFARAKGSRKI